MKTNLYMLLASFVIFGLLTFWQEANWFWYAAIFPLGYIAYSFIILTISAIRNSLNNKK